MVSVVKNKHEDKVREYVYGSNTYLDAVYEPALDGRLWIVELWGGTRLPILAGTADEAVALAKQTNNATRFQKDQ